MMLPPSIRSRARLAGALFSDGQMRMRCTALLRHATLPHVDNATIFVGFCHCATLFWPMHQSQLASLIVSRWPLPRLSCFCHQLQQNRSRVSSLSIFNADERLLRAALPAARRRVTFLTVSIDFGSCRRLSAMPRGEATR